MPDPELEITEDADIEFEDTPPSGPPPPEETPDKKAIADLMAQLKERDTLLTAMANRPVTVTAPAAPTLAPDQGAQLAAFKKYIDDNFATAPGETLVNVLMQASKAIDDNVLKPAQLERAKDWSDNFRDRKEAKDKLAEVVLPTYDKLVASRGDAIYIGTRAQVQERLQELWDAAAGRIATEAAQKSFEEENTRRLAAAKKAQDAANAPPTYSTRTQGTPSTREGNKVKIPRSFVTWANQAGYTETKDVIDLWETEGVAENWGKG